MSDASGEGRSNRRSRVNRSRAEWVTFGVASALLLVVVAAITSLWLGGTERPPQFVVRTLPVRESGGAFHVRAVVSNTGDETAEGVQVVAELTVGDEPPLEGEQMIDFLSGDDEEEVEFIFTADPADGDLEIGVRSFKVP